MLQEAESSQGTHGGPIPAVPSAALLTRTPLPGPAAPTRSRTPRLATPRGALSLPWRARSCPSRLRWWSWCPTGSTRLHLAPPPSPRCLVTGKGLGTSALFSWGWASGWCASPLLGTGGSGVSGLGTLGVLTVLGMLGTHGTLGVLGSLGMLGALGEPGARVLVVRQMLGILRVFGGTQHAWGHLGHSGCLGILRVLE